MYACVWVCVCGCVCVCLYECVGERTRVMQVEETREKNVRANLARMIMRRCRKGSLSWTKGKRKEEPSS